MNSNVIPNELAQACALGDEIADLQRRIGELARERRRLWLVANRDGGASYATIRRACGVSDAFVCKEIATARGEHPRWARPTRGRWATQPPVRR